MTVKNAVRKYCNVNKFLENRWKGFCLVRATTSGFFSLARRRYSVMVGDRTPIEVSLFLFIFKYQLERDSTQILATTNMFRNKNLLLYLMIYEWVYIEQK